VQYPSITQNEEKSTHGKNVYIHMYYQLFMSSIIKIANFSLLRPRPQLFVLSPERIYSDPHVDDTESVPLKHMNDPGECSRYEFTWEFWL